MSHAATKWAFDQPELHRDMKPSEWAVLLVLADCHNPVNGCFPSQDHICSKTNLAERAVRDQLVRLRERGLINWDSARENGRRGANRYSLAFEKGFQPAKSAGCPTGEIEHDQPAESDTYNRQNLPPNLVREPVKEPLERGAREDEFEKAYRAWPSSATDSRDDALAAWEALTSAERITAAQEAERCVSAFKSIGRKHICSFATYLRDQRWLGLAPRPVPVERAAPREDAPRRPTRFEQRLAAGAVDMTEVQRAKDRALAKARGEPMP